MNKKYFYVFVGLCTDGEIIVKIFTQENEAREYYLEYPFPGKLTKWVFIKELMGENNE